MTEIILHPEADEEYTQSAEWYANRTLAGAVNFIEEVESVFQQILQHPDRYAKISPRSRFREAILVNFPFSIVYTSQRTGQIYVIAVAHTSRKRGYWKKRKVERQ